MEKLEGILRAEEDARHLLREARDHAAEITRQAAADSERIRAEAVSSARSEIESARTSILRPAAGEAEAIAAQAERDLGGVVRVAESRLDGAVEALVAEIAG